MRNIYDIFDHIEKRPAMYLGNDYGIIALNHFVWGFNCGGGKFYSKKLNYPDFSLFTDWLGGMLKFKYEGSSMNWSSLLLEKYKEDKKALEKFFFYLKQFKAANNEVVLVSLTKKNIQYAIEHKADYLWCKVGNTSKLYYNNLKKIDKIVLFKLYPSRTLFSLLVSKDNKVIETRNSDMTDNILRNKIEKQFAIDLKKWKAINSADSKAILHQYKII
jgi:hypothetical protein